MKLCMGCMNEIEDHLMTCPHCGFNETTLRQESYYLDPGTIVGGKYIVGKVLNYGGHTVSYLGMDAEANRKVIVKEYLPSDFSTRSQGEKEVTIYSGDAQIQFENGLTNFLNEANKIQALGNPEGIARVYDCLAENDTGYVISEYVQGKTLKEILASGKRYSVSEAVAFITKILKGLCKVHPMNIIHCDISPETIMVTDTGEIKLLDFGATRYVTTANSKSLAIILKQGYAPEEQYRSSGTRGPWTDVYALGAVMYRMITGTVPQESVERALVDELKEPSKLGVSIPANIENALMNALNVYREERTPSAQVFLRELNSPTVKRIKVAKRKNETGKFPLWAKGLVAALLCMVVAGGVILIKGGSGGSNELPDQTFLVKDFVNNQSTYEEVEQWVDENKEAGIFSDDFEVKKGYMFSETPSEIVLAQSVPSGNLYQYATDHSDIDYKDGKYTGELVVYVQSNEKTSCRDLVDSQMSQYVFKQKLGDAVQEDIYVGAEGDSDCNYYDITGMELKNGTILDEEAIRKESEIAIDISDIKQITYYNGTFFCWQDEDELGDFKGQYIQDLAEQPVCKKEAGNSKPKSEGTKSLEGTPLVDSSYYTFHGNWKEGYICYQTFTGKHLDTSTEMDKLENGRLLYVIKMPICLQADETVEDFKQRLENYPFKGVEIVNDGSNKEYDRVSVVNASGDEQNYFSWEDMKDLTFQIIMKDKPQVTTRANRPSGGGNTGGGGGTGSGDSGGWGDYN